MKKAVIILSGGLDSACMMSYLKKGYQLYGITFAYGQRASEEIKAAKRIGKLLKLTNDWTMINIYGQSIIHLLVIRPDIEKFYDILKLKYFDIKKMHSINLK